MSVPNAKLRRLYMDTWERALPAFFGWAADGVADWVAPSWRRMGTSRTIFYHEDPIFYMLPLIIPDKLKAKLKPDEFTELESKLHQAIQNSSDLNWRSEDFDWSVARGGAAKVLQRYGEDIAIRTQPLPHGKVTASRRNGEPVDEASLLLTHA